MTLRLSVKRYWHGKNTETIKMRKSIGNLHMRMQGLSYLDFIQHLRIDLTLGKLVIFPFSLCHKAYNEIVGKVQNLC